MDAAVLSRDCDVQAGFSFRCAPVDDTLLLLRREPVLLQPLVEGITDGIVSAYDPTSEGTGASMVSTVSGALGSAQAATGTPVLATGGWVWVGHWVVHEQLHPQARSEVGISEWFYLWVEEG